MAGFIFLQGCDRPQGKLIDEILLSPKPELREPLDVTPIVLRYFPLGKDRQAVISELTAQGFEVKEFKQTKEGCAECDPLGIQGYYGKSEYIFPFIFASSVISLGFFFKQGKAVDISADYIRYAL
jgi:hypothetical protein